VFGEYRRFYGMEGGSSLFVVGLGLKLLELRTERDTYLVVFLAFFVAVTQYLFSQSIPMAAYTLAVVVLLVMALIGFNSGERFAPWARLRLALVLTAQALPVMVVLFVFFPRVAGHLWQLPDDRTKAKTGLSDTIEPGSITELGLSQEPAFRVDFEGPLPPSKLRYWRGPVFWHTDGRRWELVPQRPLTKEGHPQFRGAWRRYTVTLEPHNQLWVFALDLPTEFPGELSQTGDLMLLSKQPIGERRQFQLASATDYRFAGIDPGQRKRGLQLPKQVSDRVRELVRSWQAGDPAPRAVVQRALRHFREEVFYYTLTPPAAGGDPVDGFLFETRRGFCEHYATSFVILMRLAGIPARVVTGYQGGTWNPLGRFLEVKQADAHAWAEVWFDDGGWTRVDPTAAVAPERIERGLDVETQIALGEVSFNLPEGAAVTGGRLLADYLRQARQMWASIDHAWNWWVLSYGTDSQRRLLERLGVVDWRGMLRWLGGGLAVTVALAAWLILPRRRRTADPVQSAYLKFLADMARRGLVKQSTEGPADFARRAAMALPDLAVPVSHITELYLQLRYGPSADPRCLPALRRAVRRLRRKGVRPA
jgi:transglutaminase-like putative cysteine protease